MQNLKKLQDLALKLILFLVWFDLMCFSLILAGNIFKWSFFNESIGSAFFTMFGLSLGALFALAVLHIVLTLNILSNSVSHIAQEKDVADPRYNRRFKIFMLASLIGILAVVGYQGIVERNAVLYKVNQLQSRIEEVSRSSLVSQMVVLIEQDAPINELYFLRDQLLLSLEEQRGVLLLLPKEGQSGQIFYKITPWDYNQEDNTPISQFLKNLFVPQKDERARFKQLIKDQTSFAVVDRHDIRVFQPIIKDQEIKMILLLDTSRSIDSGYLMSRAKKGR